MKIMNLKSGIRDNAGVENIIEAASKSPLTNSILNNYVNFITARITSKRDRQEIFKSNYYVQVSTGCDRSQINKNVNFDRGNSITEVPRV